MLIKKPTCALNALVLCAEMIALPVAGRFMFPIVKGPRPSGNLQYSYQQQTVQLLKILSSNDRLCCAAAERAMSTEFTPKVGLLIIHGSIFSRAMQTRIICFVDPRCRKPPQLNEAKVAVTFLPLPEAAQGRLNPFPFV